MTLLLATTLLAPAAHAYDHTHAGFAAVLEGAVFEDGTVDYAVIKSRRAQLGAYLEDNANANVSTFKDDEQVAFWINSYNALTLDVVSEREPLPGSIRDILGGKVWEEKVFSVGRQKVTLNDIENKILRPRTDGRIHAVVNCASKGCPPLLLRPIVAQDLQGQLDAAAKRWVASNAFKMERGVLELSKIFQWYTEDFTGLKPGQGSAEDMIKGGRMFIEKYGGKIDGEVKKTVWMEYDWALNKR